MGPGALRTASQRIWGLQLVVLEPSGCCTAEGPVGGPPTVSPATSLGGCRWAAAGLGTEPAGRRDWAVGQSWGLRWGTWL